MSPKKEVHNKVKLKNNVEKNNMSISKGNSKAEQVFKKKYFVNLIMEEFSYISKLFDTLGIASLNHGRRNLTEEDDSNNLQILDIPEKKIFQKHAANKGAHASLKKKSFPQSIEGLEKELEELKGTSLTYQKKLRKKGLYTRLVKKRKKEDIKQKKSALKQEKKLNSGINRPVKSIKPIFNSDGSIVSNKFDFADSESKKESKEKPTINQKNNLSIPDQCNDSVNIPNLKIEETKFIPSQGPVFNKDNKMVFSKFIIPENDKKSKKKSNKDPKKILQKIKENSKKISLLEKEDKEKAVSLADKQKWLSALKRASGEKVKDDPELLRKTIAKEKNKKMHSQKKWQSRIDRVQKDKDDRQKKRTENIQARKSDKKKHKMKRALKKGSFVQL